MLSKSELKYSSNFLGLFHRRTHFDLHYLSIALIVVVHMNLNDIKDRHMKWALYSYIGNWTQIIL